MGNYILITEKVLFASKTKESFAPYEIRPLVEKYFDFQLEAAMRTEVYYCLVRAQARMAAWEKLGYFECVPHEFRGYGSAPPPLGTFEFPTKITAERRKAMRDEGTFITDVWQDLLADKGKRAFCVQFQEPKFLEALKEAALDAVAYKPELQVYPFLFPEYCGMMHANLQSD